MTLRELAEAATQGPWLSEAYADGWEGDPLSGRVTHPPHGTDCYIFEDCTEADAAFIAAANPKRVLALLDALDNERKLAVAMCETHAGCLRERDALAAEVRRLKDALMSQPGEGEVSEVPCEPGCECSFCLAECNREAPRG